MNKKNNKPEKIGSIDILDVFNLELYLSQDNKVLIPVAKDHLHIIGQYSPKNNEVTLYKKQTKIACGIINERLENSFHDDLKEKIIQYFERKY